MRPVSYALCLLLLSCAVCSADTSNAQWLPSTSYQGGANYDPRLDSPVHLWGAGMLLSDVFDSIQSQTGVVIACSPPGDENERFPVTIFLNPDDPPALRDLMAQLSWVLDCSFSGEGEQGHQTYRLLHTSIAGAAASRLERQVEERFQARLDVLDRLGSAFTTMQQALELSREEALQRYRGRDDRLLLTLLDPQRRAAAQVACRHMDTVGRMPEHSMTVLRRPDAASITWATSLSPLTPEDEADLRSAFDLAPEVISRRAKAEMRIESFRGAHRGAIRLAYSAVGEDDIHRSFTLVTVGDDRPMSPEDQLALRRALGETFSESQAARFLDRCQRDNVATLMERLTAQRDAADPLSAAARQRLAEADVPLAADARPLPWTIQEKIAKATGFNIIADALCWIAGRADPSDRAAPAGSAAAALEMMRHAAVNLPEMHDPLWEWGDVGPFLRFRTVDRDVWRAAQVPASVLAGIDSLPTRTIAESEGPAGTIYALAVSVEPESLCRLLGGLTDLQCRYGPYRNCGDPSDRTNLTRRAFLAAALEEVEAPVLRFGTSLTSGQWRQLRDGSLTTPRDLTDAQLSLLHQTLSRTHMSIEVLQESTGIWHLTDNCLSHQGMHGNGYEIDPRQVACFPDEITIPIEVPVAEPVGREGAPSR